MWAGRWIQIVLATALPVGLLGDASDRAVAAEAASTCSAQDVEYALAANLQLRDTIMGQGDGVYPIGPGRTVLRYEERDGRMTGRVEMRAYEMREKFRISSKTLFWRTTVVTDTLTTVRADPRGVVTRGRLQGGILRWTSPLHGYRTDGTLDCDGSLCGKFGAPPPGNSPLHIGPNEVTFRPFEFARDGKTFSMPSTFASKTEMPRQTGYVALSGREVSRKPVASIPCE